MKNVKAALSLGLIVTGALSLATPAAAVQTKFHFFVRWNAAKVDSTSSKSDAVSHSDVVADVAEAKKKGLDCSTGTFAADGEDVASSDVVATSDGAGGCKITASFESGKHDFTAKFDDFAGKSYAYKYHTALTGSAPEIPSEMISVKS
jgi:hypothetical protein